MERARLDEPVDRTSEDVAAIEGTRASPRRSEAGARCAGCSSPRSVSSSSWSRDGSDPCAVGRGTSLPTTHAAIRRHLSFCPCSGRRKRSSAVANGSTCLITIDPSLDSFPLSVSIREKEGRDWPGSLVQRIRSFRSSWIATAREGKHTRASRETRT